MQYQVKGFCQFSLNIKNAMHLLTCLPRLPGHSLRSPSNCCSTPLLVPYAYAPLRGCAFGCACPALQTAQYHRSFRNRLPNNVSPRKYLVKQIFNKAMHLLTRYNSKICMNAGVLLAKMTPFRSCSVVLTTALTICVLGELQIKGGVLTYAVVSAASVSPLLCSF